MTKFTFFAEPLSDLVEEDVLNSYGVLAKTGNNGVAGKLKSLAPEDLFDSPVVDASMAKCCLAGLWLLHGFLDESHSISQNIKTPEGSYWHGIMHRIEGDFGNSKYWFGRAGHHPVFEMLDQQTPGGWNYDSFVDAFEASEHSGSLDPQLHQSAVDEWTTLFEYCGKRAIGES